MRARAVPQAWNELFDMSATAMMKVEKTRMGWCCWWGGGGKGAGFMRASTSIRTVHRARMCRPRVCAGDGARGGQSIDQGRDYGGAMEDLWER